MWYHRRVRRLLVAEVRRLRMREAVEALVRRGRPGVDVAMLQIVHNGAQPPPAFLSSAALSAALLWLVRREGAASSMAELGALIPARLVEVQATAPAAVRQLHFLRQGFLGEREEVERGLGVEQRVERVQPQHFFAQRQQRPAAAAAAAASVCGEGSELDGLANDAVPGRGRHAEEPGEED